MDNCEDNKEKAACQTKDEAGQKLSEEVAPQAFGPHAVSSRADTGKPVIPPYLLESMAARNPHDKSFQETLDITEKVQNTTAPFQPHVPGSTKSNREVYDAKGAEVHPGDKARFEGDAATNNNDVDLTYEYTGKVRDFYRDVLGRNSIDNKGMDLVSTVNYGQNFQNAFWNGKQMTYGHPSEASPFKSFVLLDVTGHEITHGVTQNTSGMIYWGQSGALNEHISDVFGELIKQHALNQTADQADWLIGNGIWKDNIKGRAIRDMLNPGTAYDDPKIGKDPQPAHMKDYVRTWKDNGGVHYNSGIPNRAFALFSKAVGGNAWDKPGHVWYEASQHLGLLPSFAQFADETVKAARKLGYGEDVVQKLKDSWGEVGIKPGAALRDTLTPAEPVGPAEDKEADPNGPTVPELPKPNKQLIEAR